MSSNNPSNQPEQTLYEQLTSNTMRPRSEAEIASAYEHMDARNLGEKVENISDRVADAAKSVLLIGLPLAAAMDVVTGILGRHYAGNHSYTAALLATRKKERALRRMWADGSAYSEKFKTKQG